METGVRSTVKLIIINDGKVLLNRCYDRMNGDYYSLPGGGQEKYETLEQAIRRECLEETGYSVEPERFAALFEEINENPAFRVEYPQYAHKMLHIFVCTLASEGRAKPSEMDDSQVTCEWVEISDVANLNLLPKIVKERFYELLDSDGAVFLGSDHLTINHG